MSVKLGLRWFFMSNELQDMPADLFILLQAIVDKGSLRAAASECEMSYRHAWGVLKNWQQHFAHPLVNLKRGRGQGASLTVVGEKLLWEYKRIAARLEPELENLASELSSELAGLINSQPEPPLRIVASHGLVIASLRELAKQTLNLPLDVQFHGSLDSLKKYKSGHFDIAGFHLPEGKLGKRLLPKVKGLINPDSDCLVYALRRQQGLMMSPGNPKNIRNLSDLLVPGVRFINRQRNSGSRITFDEMLYQSGLEASKIHGYENEEFTHIAVAALVASGVADCAFGLRAAAKQFKLAFLPLNWESYWFVMPKERVDSQPYGEFIKLLMSGEFKQGARLLEGYETGKSGTIVTPDNNLSVLLL